MQHDAEMLQPSQVTCLALVNLGFAHHIISAFELFKRLGGQVPSGAVLHPSLLGKGTYEEYLERDIQTLAVLQARSKNCSVPW